LIWCSMISRRSSIKQQLFNWRADVRPRIVGKFDHQDNHILKLNAEMTAGIAVRAISTRLLTFDLPGGMADRIRQKLAYYEERAGIREKHQAPVTRTAHFCSGCPHNTSTKVPDGSRAMAGIGCHFMSVWMGRNTETFSHMGGEGVSWTGLSHFTDENHVFANLGDGTYFHSGYMAIRQAVASKANITYKVLFNDAVAMTGGQNHDGPLDPPTISKQLKAEGVKEIWLVSDDPDRYSRTMLAEGTQVRDREHIEEVQKHLRTVKGCTAIIYDQTCAAELRRRRKRGKAVDPDKRAFINPLVCEGCGDCSVQSNCISIEPLETEWGRKRKINQSSCNKDFSCVEGFCPSFVTVHGGSLKKPELPELDASNLEPAPVINLDDDVYNVAITGVGGTGVLTIGAILGMAAHLEDRAAIILDMAGLAQKGGAVLSHVRLANDPKLVTAPQIVTGEADLLLAADTVVAASQSSVALFSPENTNAVINTHLSPVSNFIFDRDFDFRENGVVDTIKKNVRENMEQVDFTKLAETVCGDAISTNIMMVGYAAQKGLLPVSTASIERAIELNAVAVKANMRAFNWGRKFAAEPDEATQLLKNLMPDAEEPDTLEVVIEKRADFLTDYQDADYAKTYRDFVAMVLDNEAKLGKSRELTNAVARNLFKLMSYKDEYEVARLYTNGEFEKQIAETFEGDFKLNYHLAPPIIGFGKKPNGRPRKRAFGPWMMRAFRTLAGLKKLRGTALDVFGYTAERRMERKLVEDYKATIIDLLPRLTEENRGVAASLARLPNDIRGFGPVKEASVEKAREAKKTLLDQFASPPAREAEKATEAEPAE
ncbi:MAG: indolepyruvate ferredoxin oxidoreductase family protein, partial [Pseudomonadota bacterium]